MDLADMQSMQKFNDGYRYLLVCIDVFSKYAWVVPLKNKTGPTLVEAFKVILTSGLKPEKIMTDQGTEFSNKHFRALMKEEDIELYNTYNETFYRGTSDSYFKNQNVALLYGQENHAIRRHVTRSGVFLQS
jgi:transposase InsO family protein